MADFWAGFGQGFAPGMQVGLQARLQKENMAAQRQKNQMEAQKQAAEVLGKFADVLKDAPEEQVPVLTKNMLSWYSQTRGIQIPKEVMSFFNSNPTGMTAMLMNQQGAGGLNLQDLDKALSDPQAFIGLIDAYNKSNKSKNAEAATAEAMGMPAGAARPQGPGMGGAQTSPVDMSMPQPMGQPQTAPMQTASMGNLQGLIAAIQRTQQAMGTPGLGREQLSAMSNRVENLQKQLELSLSNEVVRTAGQMGIDYASAPPQVKQLVQQQVFANAGLQKQAEATGSAMGGLVNPSTAADTGVSPFSTVQEARRGVGAGMANATLPTTAETEDAKVLREQTGLRKKDYRTATVSAEKMDPQLDMLGSLLEQGLKTGVTAPMELRIKKLAGEVFGKDFKDVDKASLFNQVADSMSFAFLQQIGGNDSNQDREYARSIIASLSNTPNANKAMIDFMKIANQRVRDREVQHDKFVKVCGADGRNCKGDFSEYWEAWKDRNSLRDKYDGVIKKYGLATGAPASNQVATPVGAPRGGGASVADFSAPPPDMPPLPATLPNATLPMPETQGGAAYVSPRGIRPKF